MPLKDASAHLHAIELALESHAPQAVPEASRTAVQAYNEDDCRSTEALRDWLESLRAELVAQGADVPRPTAEDGAGPRQGPRARAAPDGRPRGAPRWRAPRGRHGHEPYSAFPVAAGLSSGLAPPGRQVAVLGAVSARRVVGRGPARRAASCGRPDLRRARRRVEVQERECQVGSRSLRHTLRRKWSWAPRASFSPGTSPSAA